ncbi:NAD(P)/FAD-dependent oxidoreductase [Parenemella sanctibonifatiensis]|uniref:NADH:ubiquinone reductase (non-electrogenic) n=1 Tax=Parenemella sanctibonifatiensis TaxID=2016505 RepID=A0A255ECJ8_9ACTN|nr:NAD(P)/FAD-dependent oxidoreductase [Parenemella sanctibonifatiensis]OYN88651.1 NADH dehydrogenase FAD-containing subunit [Parenemella sanctibonifatiensis]
MNKPSRRPKVVIVGAGFAGIAATRELKRKNVDVTLIDANAFTTFQPLLYQVATGGLNPGDVTYSLRALAAGAGARFRLGKMVGLDRVNKQVVLDDGTRVDYDFLMLSQGLGANFFGIPGAQEYAMALYTRSEAISLRDVILHGLERKAAGKVPRNKQLSMVVVGGGPTGVEMAGTLAELRNSGIPEMYPELTISDVQVALVEMTDHLLGPFDDSLRRYTRRQLELRGVRVLTNTAIAEVFADHVVFKNGETEPADLVVWAGGVAGHQEVGDWGLPQGAGGRIKVTRDLRVEGEDSIFAAGDAATISEKPVPGLAQPALQMGAHVANEIVRALKGEPAEDFEYNDLGTMATIGRSSAVAELPNKIKLTGLPAWMMWVLVHLYQLLGGRNRIQAMINLGVRYLAWPRHAITIVGDQAVPPAVQFRRDKEALEEKLAQAEREAEEAERAQG